MKLALVTHNVMRGDGQSRVCYELALHALSRGVNVSLLADRVAPELVERGAEWVPVRPVRQRVHLLKVAEFARLAGLALERLPEQPDIVHAHGVVVNRAHDVNTAHFVHGSWLRSPVHTARLRRDPYGAYQWVYSTMNARWEKGVYARARAVVAISGRVRQQLMEIGVAPDRVRLIPNGVDLDEFQPGPVDRDGLGLPDRAPLALFVGDLRTPRKNLDTVLRAMLRMPQLQLAVVGDTAQSPYPALAAHLGVENRVRFLGFRRDVADLMRAADLLLFPSRYEACSLVLLEALASGLPVITAETAGGAEMVGSDAGVVLPDPDDDRRLAEAVCRLLEDEQAIPLMSKAARKAAERHSWGRMAEDYLALYERLLSPCREGDSPAARPETSRMDAEPFPAARRRS